MISCDPADLASAAKCFACLTKPQRQAILTYLLALIAGVDPNPATLMQAAKCLTCLTPAQHKAIQSYLLCTNANSAVIPEE